MKMKRGKGKKNHMGSAITDMLPWVIIACVLLVILIITLFVLKGNGISLITQIKNLLRGG